jgi:outer membrane protein
MMRVRQRGTTAKYILLIAALLAPASGTCQSLQVGDLHLPKPVSAATLPRVEAGPQQQTDGPLRLSVEQAIRMALENNLDVQLEQADQSVADFSLTRTQGGGTPLPINYNIAETPAGEIIPGVPLLASTGPTISPYGIQPAGIISVSPSYDIGHVLEPQRSLSLATQPFSLGSPIPAFDLNLFGQLGWIRRDPSTATVTSASATTEDTTITNNALVNTTLVKGFSTGTSIQIGFNNLVQSFYSGRSAADPFSHPNAIALIAQPLLRGAGRANNTRYIAIAKTNKKIAAAILEQQMISVIAGVESLYYDLLSLQHSVDVQQRALKAAQDLLSDNRQQLQVGRLPIIEVTRSEALVETSELAVTQMMALRDQQENVIRSVLDPQSLANPAGKLREIVATDELSVPADVTQSPVSELIGQALEQRPDLRQAKLQVSNGERFVAGAANARLPEVDLYGAFQNRGVLSTSLMPIGGDPLTGAPLVDPIPTGGIRASRVLEAGIQFNFPVQNRVAEADFAADRVQLQEQRLRLNQMQAQAAAEVRNAVIGLAAAKKAAQAAAATRRLQQQLLDAEIEKFRTGYSTNFAVIQQQTYLAEAETTEIMAQTAWKKSAIQLERALGNTLKQQGITMKGAPPEPKGAVWH